MDRVGAVGPARSLSHGARRQLAAILRTDRDGDHAVGAFLDAYGAAVHDFVMLMLGPGDLADRVLADTVIAVTGLVGCLRDDDLLTAWVFALARQQCRRHPPVVWREQQWNGLRGAPPRRRGRADSVPVGVVRMALLGIAPRDREVLLMSSTYCKLLSGDLAAIFEMSVDDAVVAVTGAHRRFEQALALSAAEVGYRRDPRGRAPEIGELVGLALRGVDRPVPDDRVFYMALAPDAAAYRRDVLSRIELAGPAGFPVLSAPRRPMGPGEQPRSRQVPSRPSPRSLVSAG